MPPKPIPCRSCASATASMPAGNQNYSLSILQPLFSVPVSPSKTRRHIPVCYINMDDDIATSNTTNDPSKTPFIALKTATEFGAEHIILQIAKHLANGLYRIGHLRVCEKCGSWVVGIYTTKSKLDLMRYENGFPWDWLREIEAGKNSDDIMIVRG